MKIADDLEVNFREEKLLEYGTSGKANFKNVQIEVAVDPRLSKEEKAAVLVHEIMENIFVLNSSHIKWEHEWIDWFAYPLAKFMMQCGFDPQKVFGKIGG